jgi:hypothetical protein
MEDQSLLITRDSFRGFNLRLHVFDSVRWFDFDDEALPGESLDDDVHFAMETGSGKCRARIDRFEEHPREEEQEPSSPNYDSNEESHGWSNPLELSRVLDSQQMHNTQDKRVENPIGK